MKWHVIARKKLILMVFWTLTRVWSKQNIPFFEWSYLFYFNILFLHLLLFYSTHPINLQTFQIPYILLCTTYLNSLVSIAVLVQLAKFIGVDCIVGDFVGDAIDAILTQFNLAYKRHLLPFVHLLLLVFWQLIVLIL